MLISKGTQRSNSNREPNNHREDGGGDANASDHQTADLPLGALKIAFDPLKISFGSKMAVSTLELIDLRLYIQNPLIHRSYLQVTSVCWLIAPVGQNDTR